MLSSLITSHTRIKILKKFFLNLNICSHLRGLETELQESTNSIRLELNRFEKAELLSSTRAGNKKIYRANLNHPFYNELHSIIIKDAGIDLILKKILFDNPTIIAVFLTGDFAKGIDSQTIEFIIVGQELERASIIYGLEKSLKLINKSITLVILDPLNSCDYLMNFNSTELFQLWSSDQKGY